uniref:Mu-thomitoxin-Hme1a n=1 Tax=Heriaeus mellotteei TaxID=2337432 RepID=TXHM1_HERML|nr:RecName: Full=Mu-thomitoxin-Hme1a; Short=Mu-TMTX-Hme1a; AltName: Full=Neurotoxin Hm-1 [Heriaeus mellotteei]
GCIPYGKTCEFWSGPWCCAGKCKLNVWSMTLSCTRNF